MSTNTNGAQLSVIDGGTAADPPPLDKESANALNDQIHKACSKIATDSFELVTLLEQAATGQIHAALGYPSWTAWFAENVTIDISNRDERKMMAALMSGRRMSQRAIAKVLGVDQKTICNDLRSGEENSSAAVTVGRDGKNHPRKREPKSPRKVKAEQPSRAVAALTKAVDKLVAVTDDYRYVTSRLRLRGELAIVQSEITRLQKVVDKLEAEK
jgi:transposase